MRPLRLTIQGLRSFRSAVTLDFTGRDHVAIVGDTGAGKSSILEAVTYALYGQTTFTAQGNQELMNDTSTQLRVVLRFRVSGQTWEVARALRRDGQGRVGPASAQLRRLDTDGPGAEQVEQVKPVNDRIRSLLGLDSEAFLRTVVLPQGRFARLLVEDKPADRGRILRQVWRTDELEAAGALAGAARHEAGLLRERLAQAASAHPDDPAAHLAALQAARETASRSADAAAEDERAAAAAHDTLISAATARQEAAGVAERLRDLDIERVSGTLAPITAAERRLAEEEAACEERQAGLEKELARVPADDGATSGEVAAALTALGGLGGLAATAGEAAADLRATADDAARKRAEAEGLAEGAKAARRKADGHAAKRPPLHEAAEAARRRRDAVERQHARCAERSAERDAARRRLDALHAEAAEGARRLAAARETARGAAREAAAADEHLAAAQRSEAAALAAIGLHPGDTCPICRRDLPRDWEAPDAAGLEDAEAVARAAHAAAREADAAVAALEAEGKALARQAAGAEAALADMEATLEAARRELALEAGPAPLPPGTDLAGTPSEAGLAGTPSEAGLAGAPLEAGLPGAPLEADPPAAPPEVGLRGVPSEAAASQEAGVTRPAPTALTAAQAALLDATAPLPDRDTLLAPLEAVCTETAARLAGHDDLAEALQADATARAAAAGVAGEAATGARDLSDRSRRAAAQAVERLRTAVRAVAEPFRPALDVPADAAELHEIDIRPVAEQTASARARARVLEAREAERERLRSAIEDARQARSALARRRTEEVDAPLERLVRALHRCRDILVESAGRLALVVESTERLALDIDVPAAVATREAGAMASYVVALQAKASALSQAAGEQARAAAERADAARAELAVIGRRLDARPSSAPSPPDPSDMALADLEAVVAAARAKAEDARFAERRAGEAADDFAAIVDDVQDLRALLQEVESRALALADLEDALKPGAFLKWLTHRRSHRLLVHASRMLGEMTGGRYAFVDPGEADEQWQVLDRDSGRPRSPASLSGGEQFIASLSLALGMVEMMARSGGRLESLFLDEGFGSLDRNNLDAAVQALGAVAAGGRMVAVISHVRAVAEQIDHVLAVTRGATGSRAEWLTSGQRRQLSESDTGLEAASALAGLLE